MFVEPVLILGHADRSCLVEDSAYARLNGGAQELAHAVPAASSGTRRLGGRRSGALRPAIGIAAAPSTISAPAINGDGANIERRQEPRDGEPGREQCSEMQFEETTERQHRTTAARKVGCVPIGMIALLRASCTGSCNLLSAWCRDS